MPAGAQSFMGIEGGYAYIDTAAKDTAQSLANSTGRTVSYTQDRGAMLGRVFGGYDFDKIFGFEIGAFASGNAANNYAFSGTTVTAKEEYKVTGFDGALRIKFQDTGLFAKIGAHSSTVSAGASVSINGATYAAANSSKSGTGYLAGLGYETPLSNDLFYRVTAYYYNALGGLSDANASLVTVGIVKKFN